MAAVTIDPGLPIPALDPASDLVLLFSTQVCDDPACTALHLSGVAGLRDEPVDPGKVDPADRLGFTLDVATRRLEPDDERAAAYLASEAAWLPSWVESAEAIWRPRFEHLKGQAIFEPPDARPAPAWKPGDCLFHRDLYPHDFAPSVERDGIWLISDACCPDPGCRCESVELGFHGPAGELVTVKGVLGSERPERADATGRALWKVVHEDEELIAELEQRREDIRGAGPFVVGVAYEEARRAARAERGRPKAADTRGGYLQGGATPLALVERLFDVGARIFAARLDVEDAWPDMFRVEARGAIAREGWGRVDESLCGFDVHEAPHAGLPCLEIAFAHRAEVPLDHRRQRCALGLPLIAGVALPLVRRVVTEELFGEPDADDVRFAVAACEGLLAATRAQGGGHRHGRDTETRVFEHHVELDTGPVDVRVTASHPDAPWLEEGVGEGDDDDLDDGDLDDDDLDDDELEDEGEDRPFEAALEGFTDAALDAGLDAEAVETARKLVEGLGAYAALHPEHGVWFANACVERFLSSDAARALGLSDAEVERAPAALAAVAGWLGDMGQADAVGLQRTIDRALPALSRRALSRSPTRWRPAPGDRPPAPTDPCGCGSGKRYKKCCMPR